MIAGEILFLVATAIFSVTGVLATARHSMDVLSLVIVGVVTAIGGGTIRDLMLDVPVGVRSLRVDFVDKDNKTIGQETLKEIPAAGKQKLSLDGVTVPDGMYDVKVMAVTSNGTFKELPARATGMVEGFVLSPKPALLVGGQEVQVDKVEEVTNTVG